VRPSNPLGLVAGDEILAIDDAAGQAMLDATLARPTCGNSGIASASNRRARAGTTVFAGVKVGTKVTIKHVDGTTETKAVEQVSRPVDCRDPFGRQGKYIAKATTRPDGAAVLHIPSFYPMNFDENDPEGSVAKLQAAIKTEFDKVKSAPYLVIDVRANGGGSTPIGLAIAAGMPGATAANLAHCQSRVPYSTSYENDFDYTLEPGSEFAYTGKVAVLSDGNAFSATDYFIHTVKRATSAIVVGRPNAGAYGGSSYEVEISDGPGVIVYPDAWRCTDPTGKPLEGQTVTPDIEQDLAPADLAQGLDSDVEAAVARLKQ
jgi:C-terminal processing protease CtpA/Prc